MFKPPQRKNWRRDLNRRIRHAGGVARCAGGAAGRIPVTFQGPCRSLPVPRVSRADIGTAASSIEYACDMIVKMFTYDPTKAFLEIYNQGKHCSRDCQKHTGPNERCNGRWSNFYPARCSEGSRELCKSYVAARVPNKQIIQRGCPSCGVTWPLPVRIRR